MIVMSSLSTCMCRQAVRCEARRDGFARFSKVHLLWLWQSASHFRPAAPWPHAFFAFLCPDVVRVSHGPFPCRQYALDREELNNWVMQEWLKHYDPDYLDEESLPQLFNAGGGR